MNANGLFPREVTTAVAEAGCAHSIMTGSGSFPSAAGRRQTTFFVVEGMRLFPRYDGSVGVEQTSGCAHKASDALRHDTRGNPLGEAHSWNQA